MATLEGNSSGEQDLVVVDDTSGAKQVVSWQIVQGIYNQITGKREEIGISKPEAFEITFGDITQLHKKIAQTLEQYTLRACSNSVTVFYTDDNKESFSSYEKFQALNMGTARKTESVMLQYEFAITPSISKELQSYKVNIRLVSRAALNQRMRNSIAGVPAGFLRMIQGGSISATITYVDYAVARSLKAAIDEWIGTLTERKLNSALSWLQVRSQHVPRVMGFAALVAGCITTYSFVPTFVTPATPDFQVLVRFLFVGASLSILGFQLAKWLGEFTEDALDGLSSCSTVVLTDADAKVAKEHSSANTKSVIMAVVTGICSGVSSAVAKIGLSVMSFLHSP